MAMSPLSQGMAKNLDAHCTGNAQCWGSYQEKIGEVQHTA